MIMIEPIRGEILPIYSYWTSESVTAASPARAIAKALAIATYSARALRGPAPARRRCRGRAAGLKCMAMGVHRYPSRTTIVYSPDIDIRSTSLYN